MADHTRRHGRPAACCGRRLVMQRGPTAAWRLPAVMRFSGAAAGCWRDTRDGIWSGGTVGAVRPQRCVFRHVASDPPSGGPTRRVPGRHFGCWAIGCWFYLGCMHCRPADCNSAEVAARQCYRNHTNGGMEMADSVAYQRTMRVI